MNGLRKWSVKANDLKQRSLKEFVVIGSLLFSVSFSITIEAGSKKHTVITLPAAFSMKPPTVPDFPQSLKEKLKTNRTQVAPTVGADPLSQDWALNNIGFFKLFSAMGKSDLAPCANSGITVAVIDTGIDYNHPELKDQLWVESGAKPYIAGWDFVSNTPFPYDLHGHGSHIAGIISATVGNGIGIAGVCPGVTIMALKYYDNGSNGYNNLTNTVKAIRFAVEHGAQIINYSGGGSEPAPSEKAAIAEAREKGVLFVAAAGNDGRSNDKSDRSAISYYPASYDLDNIVSVASTDSKSQVLSTSNFGKSVHLAAPGFEITSTFPGGGYRTMSGTSQATAFVTGAAALLAAQMKAAGQPFDYRRIKNWLVSSGAPLPPVPTAANRLKTSNGFLSLPQAIALEKQDLRKAKTVEVATKPAPASTKENIQ